MSSMRQEEHSGSLSPVVFQVSYHPWAVLSTRQPGSWAEVRWGYRTAAGWSAYRKGTALRLTFRTFTCKLQKKKRFGVAQNSESFFLSPIYGSNVVFLSVMIQHVLSSYDPFIPSCH